MAVQIKMRVNRVVEGESGNRKIREVFLTNTSSTGTQLQNNIQIGNLQLNFLGNEGDDLKWGSIVTMSLEVEEETKEPTPS